MDENLAHCSYEAGILEDPDMTPLRDMWKLTVDPEDAPEKPEDFTVHFEKGLPVKLVAGDKTITEPLELFLAANTIARNHGVGRIDIVENRFIGLKSRGCYETPGLTILRSAHIDLEGLVLDREIRALRDQFVTYNYSKLLYNGLYFSPEREFLEGAIVASQKTVNGTVRCRAYKGSLQILGRSSETEKLYDMNESSMDEIGDFSPSDSTGFIAVQAIRLKKYVLPAFCPGAGVALVSWVEMELTHESGTERRSWRRARSYRCFWARCICLAWWAFRWYLVRARGIWLIHETIQKINSRITRC